MKLKRIATCAIAIALSTAFHAHAAADEAGGIRIKSCEVFSADTKDISFDCTEIAGPICHGLDFCELPIGYNLTNGNDLDANEDTWELVRVEYTCAGNDLYNGPHYQNDHATMSLFCRRF